VPEDNPEFDLGDRATYHYWNNHVIRFADLDPANHVNNVAYAQYFESGRVAFWHQAGRHTMAPGSFGVIASLTIDYRSQMDFPGDVEVGTRALSLGRSSTRLGQGLFRDGACVATSVSVMVLVDRQTARSTPLPDDLRAAVLALSAG
jgi:acyl-CoA thioester hydrolase